jgi:predicted GNAT family acetyltransferase
MLEQYGHWASVCGKTVYGIVVAGRIVASCGSVRENGKSAEAWVITEPEFRRRGYARQVTAAWAHDLRRQGKVAFYSHTQDNIASRAVARSLGLIQFAEAVAYS